jgi:hypothetical protein
MEPGFAVGLGVLWVLFSILSRRGKQEGRKDGAGSPRIPAPRQVGLPPSTGSDPTQREGARLQDLLRELGRTLDQATAQRGKPPVKAQTVAPKARNRNGIKTGPEVKSLEESAERPERVVVDTDDEAEAIVARRIAAAEANARPLGAADHMTFDARIRQQPADATAVKTYSMRRIRDAIVWREILGPPVSLKDPAEP